MLFCRIVGFSKRALVCITVSCRRKASSFPACLVNYIMYYNVGLRQFPTIFGCTRSKNKSSFIMFPPIYVSMKSMNAHNCDLYSGCSMVKIRESCNRNFLSCILFRFMHIIQARDGKCLYHVHIHLPFAKLTSPQ